MAKKPISDIINPMGSDNDIQTIEIADNDIARIVCGLDHENINAIEDALSVTIRAQGNVFHVRGDKAHRDEAASVLRKLEKLANTNKNIGPGDVSGLIKTKALGDEVSIIKTSKKPVMARTPNQDAYIKSLRAQRLVFGVGPAGTGKTFLAIAHAVELLNSGVVEKIILTRPAVEAGERLGFLPGDMKDKVDPYLQPLYDALADTLDAKKYAMLQEPAKQDGAKGENAGRSLANKFVEIAPLAFMRGRTLTRAAIILDEAQNTTTMQMKMFLTRLGEGSRMIVTGDPSQIDLPIGTKSGLVDASEKLRDKPKIGIIEFKNSDIVRDPLVAEIIEAYDQADAAQKPKPLHHNEPHAEPAPQRGTPKNVPSN